MYPIRGQIANELAGAYLLLVSLFLMHILIGTCVSRFSRRGGIRQEMPSAKINKHAYIPV